jgi:hypothetical protein
VVDLTSRAYDGIGAIGDARDADRHVLAVGQHDDAELRRRALAAGAVFIPYRKAAVDGAGLVTRWLADSGIETPA